MARHRESSDFDRPSSAQRLDSLGLRASRPGWVPDASALELREESWPDAAASLGGAQPAADRLEPSTPVPGSPRVLGPAELARGWAKDRAPMWAHGALDRATPGSVLSFAAAVLAALVATVMVIHHHSASGYSPSYEASAAVTGGGSSSSTSSVAAPTTAPDPATSAASIVVDVGGRVRKPGLVTLPAGARVADAISAAGGPLRHRELATTNLAARVSDGQLLLVGTKAPAVASDGSEPGDDGSGTPSSSAPVALNSATLEQLETLPNIGPVTGQKILDWRTAHGGFTSIEQLQQVSGIGPATYADLSPLVTL